MKDFTKKAAKAVVGTFVLGSLLLTTACGNENKTAPASTPEATQSAAATPSPSATPSASAAGTIGPWGINIDDVLANHTNANVAKTFPNETPESLKEGVLYALNTYQGLVGRQNYYHARTASDNTLLFPDADKFDKTFYDKMTARTDAHGGQFQDIITFAPADAEITGGHKMDPKNSVRFKSSKPDVYAEPTANGNVLTVSANASMYAPTADGKLVTVDLNYWVKVSHVGQGKWLVSDLGYKVANINTTDSAVAPEAPNGK